jgi:hypothetical protein
MAGGIEYNEVKLKELVLYVANRSFDDPFFGKTKLNKLLYFSDFQAFRQYGISITGAVYQHLPQGPCPQRMLPVLKSLESEDEIAIVPEDVGGMPQERIVAMRSPRIELFTKEEVVVVEEVLSLLRKLTNTQASERSHVTMSWKLTRNQQEIPYGAALISSGEPTEEDLRWLESVDSDGFVGA